MAKFTQSDDNVAIRLRLNDIEGTSGNIYVKASDQLEWSRVKELIVDGN